MTTKEKLIVKKLGYSTFAIYSYIKSDNKMMPKDLVYELNVSRQAIHRSFTKLKHSNILTITGKTNSMSYKLNDEKDWSL